jgi:hypothetical protein
VSTLFSCDMRPSRTSTHKSIWGSMLRLLFFSTEKYQLRLDIQPIIGMVLKKKILFSLWKVVEIAKYCDHNIDARIGINVTNIKVRQGLFC